MVTNASERDRQLRPPEVQLEFFRTRLGRLQPKLVLEAFNADLARTNLNVMWAALRDTEALVQSTKRPPKDPRAAVLARYERAAAAIAQLFPVFFVFESAWRTYVATRLNLIYGGESWWHGVRDLLAQKGDVTGVANLGTRPARGEVVRTLAHIIGGVQRPSDLTTTFELLEIATLRHLEDLIDRHWSDMAHPFSETQALGRPTSDQFGKLFARVRKARNDAYHHRVVSGREDVVSAAEQLVDLLNIHMGDRLAGIAAVQPAPLKFKVLAIERHQ